MSEPTMETLVQRLDRLERENRRLKRVAAVVLAGIAAMMMMGQAQCNLSKTASKASKVVEAQEFILRDMSGKVRAEIGMTTDLGPELSFLDVTGKKRLSLSVSDRAGGQGLLGLDDKDGNRRIHLNENLLWFLDRKGNIRGNLSLEDDGSPTLSILGEIKGAEIIKPEIHLVERNGNIALQFVDQKSKVRAQLDLGPSGSPNLTLLDDKGQTRVVLGTTSLVNTNTEAKTQTAESSLTLFNKDGKVIWRAPR